MTGAAAPSQPSLEDLVQRIAAGRRTYCLRGLAHIHRTLAENWRPLDPRDLVALLEEQGHPLPAVHNLAPIDFAVVTIELARAQAGIGRIAPPEGGTDREFLVWGTMARRALRRHLESRGGRYYDLQQVLLGHRPPSYRGVAAGGASGRSPWTPEEAALAVTGAHNAGWTAGLALRHEEALLEAAYAEPKELDNAGRSLGRLLDHSRFVPVGTELLAISVVPALWAFDVAGALTRDPRMVSFALFAFSVAGGRQLEALDRGSLGQRWDLESLQVAMLDAYGPSRDFSVQINPPLREALEREAQTAGVDHTTLLQRECLVAAFLALLAQLGPLGELPGDFGGFQPLRDDWLRRLRREVEHDLVTRRKADVGAVELPEALPDSAGSGPLRRVEAREDLRAWIREAKLSPLERQVLQLEFEKDLNTAEAARQLGRSEGAVRVHRSGALKKLRALM
jgi:RNA polymerase sigma factor (sigma-70 family)